MYPALIWDRGTGYDLFVSLHLLHFPEKFNLRPTWASGMRSRLPGEARETLELAERTVFNGRPAHWVYTLPAPKDGDTVIQALARIPPAMRLPTLTLRSDTNPVAVSILMSIMERGVWDSADLTQFKAVFRRHWDYELSVPEVVELFAVWTQAEAFGERYLTALRAYHEVFFAEEERRIRPALDEALARAQDLAQHLEVPALMETLASDVGYDLFPPLQRLILAPSFWCSPFTFVGKLEAQTGICLFGARPLGVSLVPGETLSDSLVETLKALADPTRLRILQYLAAEPRTPTELSRLLRLRVATVGHHLKHLKMAGLVRIRHKEGKEHIYATRPEAVATTFEAVKDYIEKGTSEKPTPDTKRARSTQRLT